MNRKVRKRVPKNGFAKLDTRKAAFIEALQKSLGIVTTACINIGISRQTYYDWLKDDEDFAKEVDHVAEMALDFAESQLHQQIKEKNTAATIFYLKTKGKKRGFIEQQDFGLPDKDFNITLKI